MIFLEKTIQDKVANVGYRQAARYVLNSYFLERYELGLSELPDSAEICTSIDDLESMIKEMLENDSFNSDELLYYMNDIFDEDSFQNTMFD